MSLVGKNGYKIGSEEYFKDLNEKTIIGDLMKEFLYSSCSTDYKLMVEKLCDNIINTVVTIYNDLSKYASYLIFFSKSERERMSEFLKKLDDVLKLVDRGKKSEIFYSLRLLSLDDYNTKLKSRVNLSKIEEAAKRVKNGGSARISYSVGYDLIKKAVDYGVDYTVNADLTKMLFFSEVLEDKGKDFLEDLWHYLRYDKEKNTLVGRCQSVILSDSYIDKLESEIFGRARFYMGNYDSYQEVIVKSLQSILDTVIDDIKISGIINDKDDFGNYLNLFDNFDEVLSIDYSNYFEAVDITDKLHKIMDDAKKEFLFQSIKAPIFSSSQIIFSGYIPRKVGSFFLSYDTYNMFEKIIYNAYKSIHFALLVEDNARYDLKSKKEWKQNCFIYEGKLLRYDAPGNIVFGYLAKLFGFTEEFAKFGAGIYQDGLFKTNFKNRSSYFDDPVDQEMIELGYDYYDRTVGRGYGENDSIIFKIIRKEYF